MSFSSEADVPQQTDLPFPCDEDLFRITVEKALGKRISLTFTNNATSLISVRKRGSETTVRLHRVFLGAGGPVIDEIAGFIRRGRGKTPFVRAFIRQHKGFLRPATQRRRSLRPAGKWHDLVDICGRINAEYFNDSVAADITWGSRNHRGAARRRTLGSYNRDAGLITINPLLDRKTVPRYFVEFIVYHEMLHADMGVRISNGRRLVHTREFRVREKLFREYGRAIGWEKKWCLGTGGQG
jgi:hypothetical protein